MADLAIWPVISTAIGVIGYLTRALSSDSDKKQQQQQQQKLTLIPPLFERHADRNSFTRSPLDLYDIHRRALFNHWFADQHLLIAEIHMAPMQQSYHVTNKQHHILTIVREKMMILILGLLLIIILLSVFICLFALFPASCYIGYRSQKHSILTIVYLTQY